MTASLFVRLGVAAATTLGVAGAHAAALTLVPAQSDVSFELKQVGVPLQGRFKRFAVQTDFNPKAPQASQVNLTFELASATVSAEADPEMGKPDWFATAKFPQATFQSTAIKPVGPGRYEVAGKLAIKGSTRDVVVPMVWSQSGSGGTTGTASGAITLKRLDFKVGDGMWADTSVVANEVQVKFKFVLTGVAP